jgi:hypothetical protein
MVILYTYFLVIAFAPSRQFPCTAQINRALSCPDVGAPLVLIPYFLLVSPKKCTYKQPEGLVAKARGSAPYLLARACIFLLLSRQFPCTARISRALPCPDTGAPWVFIPYDLVVLSKRCTYKQPKGLTAKARGSAPL